jgi:hypothetical protein
LGLRHVVENKAHGKAILTPFLVARRGPIPQERVPSFTATAPPATEKAALEGGLFLSYSLLSEYQIEE